jgi:GGDEF domain-containing protein
MSTFESGIRNAWLRLYDPVSGLPLPEVVYDRLRQSLLLAQREPLAVTLMLISWDIVHAPPNVHIDGQLLEREIGVRIATCLRASDTIGKFSDGELGILLPNANDATVPYVASRVMVRMTQLFDVADGQVGVRPYAGFTVAPWGEHSIEPEHLVDQARSAIAAARVRGGGFAAWESPEAQLLLNALERSA